MATMQLELALALPGGGFGGFRGFGGGGGGGGGGRGGRGGRGRGRGRGGGGRGRGGDRPKVHTDRLSFAQGGPAALNTKQRAIKKSKQHRQKRNALHYKATKKYGTDFSQTNAAYRAAFGESDGEEEEEPKDGGDDGEDAPYAAAGSDSDDEPRADAARSKSERPGRRGDGASKPKQSALDYERRAYLQARGLDEETRRAEKKEAVRAAAERHVKKKQRDKSRSKMLQRDRRGQPKAKHMIEHLLEKIQASR